jgi:hypothetical protein
MQVDAGFVQGKLEHALQSVSEKCFPGRGTRNEVHSQQQRSGEESTSPPAPLRDGEGSRKAGSEKTTDLVKDAVGMVQDEMVGETKDDDASGSKPSIATAVARGPWEVRSAIGLDDQACILAVEIYDQRTDGMLTAEFGLHDLPAT